EAILNATLYGFVFTQALGILFLGPISDKYGRKPVLLGSTLVYIASSILCGFCPNITTFIICRIIQGFAAGGLMVISTALVKDCFQEKVRDKVLTLVMVFAVIGPLLSPILGAWLISIVNWQATLIFPGLLMILGLILIPFLGESLPKNEKYTGSIASVLVHMGTLCKNKAFTYFLISMGIFSLPFLAYLSVSAYIMEDGFGLSQLGYSLFLGANVVIGTICMLIVQKCTKKTGPRSTAYVILVCCVLSGILMLVFGHINEFVFIGCFIPCAIAAITARPYALGILLRQYDKDTGAVSALFNFTLIFLGCIGMILGTLPWSSYVNGLGICILGTGIIAVIFWILLKADGMRLKGMEK
ncbi:MAG TPA: MFS transporter, partial [Methanocorpusculum sp.]|nr:MFS transporter [Methanocorpusculum sp.]